MNKFICSQLLGGLSAFCGLAQSSPTPPGVPEPGLVIWGSVVNATNTSQQIAIASASWSVTDGTKSAVYSATSKPPVQIFTVGDKSYYLIEVPFDTRRFGNIVLSDPAGTGIDSFELKSSSPPSYTLTPTVNGALASVRSIDGAPASGSNVPVPGFTSATRGRVIRVDLASTPAPSTDSYSSWAAGFFGSANDPNAGRSSDPDGDGFSNEQEFRAGTNPKDANSVLRILSLSVGPTQTTVGWSSISNKQYVIEAATNALGPWSASDPLTGAGTTLQSTTGYNPADPRKFYRIRVLTP